MEIVETISKMKSLRQSIHDSVGFVPTMGYLHKGHLSLVKLAKASNSAAIVSIFVNPTQFGPSEDFTDYPRDLERDLASLKHENTDIVFIPSGEEMYPPNFSSWVEVEKITHSLEGSQRPGHFKGVTTIVAKLFNITEPTRAYFGQKDAQQTAVIKQMVSDLNMNLQIIIAPTIRENDGLAMSSRNIFLNHEERQAATVLFRALNIAKQLHEKGEKNIEHIRKEMTSLIIQEPLAQIDYISIADAQTLEELDQINRTTLVSLAVKIGKTRLIDNMIF